MEMPRETKDNGTNENGSLSIDLCRITGLHIANGRVGYDAQVGECKYMGRNGSSLIDYVLVSQNVLDMFTSFGIGDPNIFSDHCVVSFSLLCNRSLEKSQINDEDFESSTVDSKYEWDKTLLNESVIF